MSSFERVGFGKQQAMQVLAGEALEVLRSAGLPQSIETEEGTSAGVTAEVDLGDDEVGGVYLTWRPDGRLVDEAALAVLHGRRDDPVISRSADFRAAMRGAILSILVSSGFRVEESPDDVNPLAVRVLGRI
jgi:hypothetical protein